MWLRNSYYSYVFSFRGSFGAAYRPLNLVTTDSLAGKAGTASIKTGGEMRKTRVNTGFHAHAESVGKLRRLRKSRYSLNNPETWASCMIPDWWSIKTSAASFAENRVFV